MSRSGEEQGSIQGAGEQQRRPSTQGPAAGAAFDIEAAAREIPGGLETALELAELFLEEYEAASYRIRRGVSEANASAVRREAHTLKSSAAIFAADRMVRAAERVETIAAAGDVTAAARALESLFSEADRVMAELRAFRDMHQSHAPP